MYAYWHVDAPIQRTNRDGDSGDLTLQLKHTWRKQLMRLGVFLPALVENAKLPTSLLAFQDLGDRFGQACRGIKSILQASHLVTVSISH